MSDTEGMEPDLSRDTPRDPRAGVDPPQVESESTAAAPAPWQDPSALVVGLRVLMACIGWATLTGIVAAALYLAWEMTTNSSFPFDGGGLFVIAAVYGGTVGFAAGIVLGLGAAVSAAVATHTGPPQSPQLGRRVVRVTRAGFVVTALLVVVVWRLTAGDSDRWLSSWPLVLTVVLAVAFGVWRSGRTAGRTVLGPAAPRSPVAY